VPERNVAPRSLYVHVPFCVRRCSYCDFAVQATREAPVEAWLEAVAGELRLTVAGERGGPEPWTSTRCTWAAARPRCWARRDDAAAGARWRRGEHWDRRRRVDVRGQPGELHPGARRGLAAAGVNRISLGAQTFHGRRCAGWVGCTAGGAGAAMAAARAAGIENVSMDLIFGLPARLGRDWDDDLDRALAWSRSTSPSTA
jgi:oxygen-independent coproporphyrinogen III oxidase